MEAHQQQQKIVWMWAIPKQYMLHVIRLWESPDKLTSKCPEAWNIFHFLKHLNFWIEIFNISTKLKKKKKCSKQDQKSNLNLAVLCIKPKVLVVILFSPE